MNVDAVVRKTIRQQHLTDSLEPRHSLRTERHRSIGPRGIAHLEGGDNPSVSGDFENPRHIQPLRLQSTRGRHSDAPR